MRQLGAILMVAVFFLASNAGAQQISEAKAQSDARDLVKVFMSETTFEVMSQLMAELTVGISRQSLRSQLRREPSPSELEKLKSVLRRTITEILPKKVWEDAYIPIYRQHFTAAEIEGLVTIYNTPLGRRLLEVEPKMAQSAAKVGQDLFKAHSDEIGRRFQQEIAKESVPPRPADRPPVRVGGNVKAPLKIRDVAPVYPAIAQSARVQGVVILETTVGLDGKVIDAKVVKSIPLLDQAAVDAVNQWEFEPTLLNGVVVPVIMTTTVTFALSDGQAKLTPTAPSAQRSESVPTLGESLRNLQNYIRREQIQHAQRSKIAGAVVQFDTMGVDFDAWLKRFGAQLKGNWGIPGGTIPGGRVVVRFSVYRDGRIADIGISTFSKFTLLDEISQKAIAASNPAEPLPGDYKNEFAAFTVTFTYNESPGQ